MKTIVSKIVKTEVPTNLEIEGATLLSVDEARVLPFRLRQHDNWWWLRSPGKDSDYTISVSSGGYDDTSYVYCDCISARPALIIRNFESSNFEIGDIFKFDGKKFEIISKDLAFCLGDIGLHRFDDNSNNYEKSAIKKYVDEWFERII